MLRLYSDVQNQLEHTNKTIHESEKEMKRLESEQAQLALSTNNANEKSSVQQSQQTPTLTPTLVNGFTLEKLDHNDVRRFVSFT
jgi:predicted  nucleic acid-binding Zn-ribbon protein